MRLASVLVTSVTVLTATIDARAGRVQVTFTKDLAPILQQRCQICHRAGPFAPMSLVTYKQTRPWARSIKEKVLLREMPPWFIDKHTGVQQFSNDRSLSDQEIATIVKWVDEGAPEGDPSDMPPLRQFPDGKAWQIGRPDLIVTLPQDLTMEAKGPDWWPVVLADPALAEDRYIHAVQIIPTKGDAVIHHVRTSAVEPDAGTAQGGQAESTVGSNARDLGVFLGEYTMGKGDDVFQEDSGRLIKAGTKINFQFHLHSSDSETLVNVALGLKLYPKGYVPKHVITWIPVYANELDFRTDSNSINRRSDAYTRLIKPARLLSFLPHVHYLGKAECIEAIYPNGKMETLSCATLQFNWLLDQFNWHINYVYANDASPLLPAGTILHSIVWHKNSTEKRFNPDPDTRITWLSYYYMSEDEFKKEIEAREVGSRTVANPQ